MRSFAVYTTPIGDITLAEDDAAIIELHFGAKNLPGTGRKTPLLEKAAGQLAEYFAGTRKTFDLPLRPEGTAFQMDVWRALQAIPYGETRTYQQIALAVGRPKACRAVGLANRTNPLAIFIPCHRVIGKNGSLTGFGGGLPVKRRLLDLEAGVRPLPLL